MHTSPRTALSLLAFLASSLASPTATAQAAPEASATDAATIIESAVGGGRSGGTFFFVSSVDGQPAKDNILLASLRLSAFRGADLRIASFARKVPAGNVKLKLAAKHAYAAPIQSLFQSSGHAPLESELEVVLAPGKRYRVTGAFDAFRNELWLEDEGDGSLLGSKILASASPEVTKAMEGHRYTCCNLHYDDDWISDGNWASLPMIPAGSRIKVVEYSKDRAKVLVEGRSFRVGLEYGLKTISVKQFVDRLLVNVNPSAEIDALPEHIRRAVLQGQVMVGMTRPQVILALGYPRPDTTLQLESETWIYWTTEEEKYSLGWNASGESRLRESEHGLKWKGCSDGRG